jgi:hypothetical protein
MTRELKKSIEDAQADVNMLIERFSSYQPNRSENLNDMLSILIYALITLFGDETKAMKYFLSRERSEGHQIEHGDMMGVVSDASIASGKGEDAKALAGANRFGGMFATHSDTYDAELLAALA